MSRLSVENAQYPLSEAEREAMARYVASIRKQLQEVSDLFGSRYGESSSLAHLAGKALVFTTLLDHELGREAESDDPNAESSEEFAEEESVIVKAAHQGR